ncbi:unnamed protein product [Ectocarpus sp. 12 AP-2014]
MCSAHLSVVDLSRDDSGGHILTLFLPCVFGVCLLWGRRSGQPGCDSCRIFVGRDVQCFGVAWCAWPAAGITNGFQELWFKVVRMRVWRHLYASFDCAAVPLIVRDFFQGSNVSAFPFPRCTSMLTTTPYVAVVLRAFSGFVAVRSSKQQERKGGDLNGFERGSTRIAERRYEANNTYRHPYYGWQCV